jgi:hypothetical protein
MSERLGEEFRHWIGAWQSGRAEATERGVDTEDLIDAIAKRIAERFGNAPVESTMRAIVWQAMKF